MKYKINIIVFIITVVMLNSSLIIGFFIYDPLKLYHKSYFQDKLYLHNNMRIQAKGIINNYTFDSVIMGASTFANTSSKNASEIIGGKFISLTLDGSDNFERNIILQYILKYRQINKVIYALDIGLSQYRSGHPHYPSKTFDYLYDNNELNDFKIYWNGKFINCLLTLSNKVECIGNKVTIDKPQSWDDNINYNSRFGTIKNWYINNPTDFKFYYNLIKSINKEIPYNQNLYKQRYKSVIKHLSENLLNNVIDNPNTEFLCIIPPLSRARYAIMAKGQYIDYLLFQQAIKYITLQSNKYKNLKVYGYANESFLDNVKNYEDLSHYHSDINKYLIGQVSKNKGLLTSSNIDIYLKNEKNKALNYDLKNLKLLMKKIIMENKK